jgi:chromosome partitioning protein
MKLSVFNLKGGTGKTTSAVFLAMALSKKAKPLLIDADPQGSVLSWSETAEVSEQFPFTVVGLPVKDLHKRLSKFEGDYQHIVIDTPPGDVPIVRSSLLAVDRAILAISHGSLNVDRLRPTLDLVDDVKDFNEKLNLSVLLTRVRKNTKTLEALREIIPKLGLDLLKTEVTLLEDYGKAHGLVPNDLGEYEAVLEELQQREVKQ